MPNKTPSPASEYLEASYLHMVLCDKLAKAIDNNYPEHQRAAIEAEIVIASDLKTNAWKALEATRYLK